jgi:Holliday junction resolvasome RuvABC endonuclease subunit
MQKQPITILAINPGAKYLGIAIFKGNDLRDWAIKVVGGKWSQKKMIKIQALFSELILRYRPDVLAMKKLNPSRSSTNLDVLISEMRSIARKKKISVHEYCIEELKRFYSPDKRISKRQLAALIASEYPALVYELDREITNKNKYYERVFEAVGLGELLLDN